MTVLRDLNVPDAPGAVASLLVSLRAGLAGGRPELRATALRPLQGPGLRAAMLMNPRLTERINERLASQKAWGVPEDLAPFDEAENVIHLLTSGPENCCTDIGLAWHGNTLSRIVLRGGTAQLSHIDLKSLRRALTLRRADTPTAAELPSAAHLLRDGALCLMAWADRLPAQIAPTVLAVLVRDPALFDLHPIGDDCGNKAASLAKAWLNADRAGGS